jgi:hypothetical protein
VAYLVVVLALVLVLLVSVVMMLSIITTSSLVSSMALSAKVCRFHIKTSENMSPGVESAEYVEGEDLEIVGLYREMRVGR